MFEQYGSEILLEIDDSFRDTHTPGAAGGGGEGGGVVPMTVWRSFFDNEYSERFDARELAMLDAFAENSPSIRDECSKKLTKIISDVSDALEKRKPSFPEMKKSGREKFQQVSFALDILKMAGFSDGPEGSLRVAQQAAASSTNKRAALREYFRFFVRSDGTTPPLAGQFCPGVVSRGNEKELMGSAPCLVRATVLEQAAATVVTTDFDPWDVYRKKYAGPASAEEGR